jgi:hypothetical protein
MKFSINMSKQKITNHSSPQITTLLLARNASTLLFSFHLTSFLTLRFTTDIPTIKALRNVTNRNRSLPSSQKKIAILWDA